YHSVYSARQGSGGKHSDPTTLRRSDGTIIGKAAVFQPIFNRAKDLWFGIRSADDPFYGHPGHQCDNAENGTLREAQDYSDMLAGLVYCVRAIGLELLLPCKDRALQGGPEIQNFFEQRKEYLQDGSMSVLSCMISLLAYGKRIAMEYGNAGPPVLSSMAMRFP
ncbi:hypothetical protein E4U24_005879, partial [Claviceps purpurea]